MTGEIEKHVDAVVANLRGESLVVPTGDVAPCRGDRLESRSNLVLGKTIVVANDLRRAPIEVLQRANQEIAHGVLAKVGRDEAQANSRRSEVGSQMSEV